MRARTPRNHVALNRNLQASTYTIHTHTQVTRHFFSPDARVARAAEALLSEMVSRAPRGTPPSIFNLVQPAPQPTPAHAPAATPCPPAVCGRRLGLG